MARRCLSVKEEADDRDSFGGKVGPSVTGNPFARPTAPA